MNINTKYNINDKVFVDHEDISKDLMVTISTINIHCHQYDSQNLIDISYGVIQDGVYHTTYVYEHNILKKI